MVTTLRTDHTLGFSQAARVGNLLFVSGQVAADEQGGVVGGEDIRAHVEQVFKNVRAVVEAGGSRLDLIAKLTVFTTSIEHLEIIREVRKQLFGPLGHYPASTVVEITGLARPDYRVEIEAVAAVPQAARAGARRSRSRVRRPASAPLVRRGRRAATKRRR